jgi:hypothetical protein
MDPLTGASLTVLPATVGWFLPGGDRARGTASLKDR